MHQEEETRYQLEMLELMSQLNEINYSINKIIFSIWKLNGFVRNLKYGSEPKCYRADKARKNGTLHLKQKD